MSTHIESLLNSGSLSFVSLDPNDLSALVSGHFLNIAPLSNLPEPNLLDMNLHCLSPWQLLSRIFESDGTMRIFIRYRFVINDINTPPILK